MNDENTAALELRSVGEDGVIEGIAVKYNVVDSYRTSFAPDALTEAGPLPMLWSHDPAEPIGRWMEVRSETDGLHVKGKLNLEVARAREVHALLKAGDVSGLSVGFRTDKDERRADGTRHITRGTLREISIVTVPAVPGSGVTSVRAEECNSMTVDSENFEAVTRQLEAMDARLRAAETRANRPADEHRDEPDLETRAFSAFMRRGRESLGAEETRGLTVAADTAAGYLVAPSPLASEILKNASLYSPLRGLARVLTISSSSILLPRQTTAPAGAWVAETGTRTATTPAYDRVEITAHEAAVYVDVSHALLEDSAFDLEAEIAADLGEAFGKLEAAAFVAGDGSGKPYGFVGHADVADTLSGAAVAITADSLIDLYHAIPSLYVGNAVWGMNRQTMATVRKLKAGDGTYLWTDALSAGNPPTILGRPVVEMPELANVAAAARPIVFGDFGAGYRIVDRIAFSLMRDPYSLATTGQVRFHARRRVGGDVAKGEALRTLKVGTGS